MESECAYTCMKVLPDTLPPHLSARPVPLLGFWSSESSCHINKHTFKSLALKHFCNTSKDMNSEMTELPPALGTSRIFTASFERFIRVKWRLGSKSQNTIPPLLLSCNNDKNLNHWLRRTVKFSPRYILHGWNCSAGVWERTPASATDNIGVPGVPPW